LADSEGWAWLPMNASLMGMLTRTFSANVWYVAAADVPANVLWTIWFVLGGIIGLVTLAVTTRGSSAQEVDRNFAIVLVASVFLCPLGWIYYLWLALPPLVALWARHTPEQDAPRWPRLLLWTSASAFAWPIVFTRLGQPDSWYLRHPDFA